MATLRPAAHAVMIGTALCALSCGAKSLVDQVCPSNPQRSVSSVAMTAMEFCQVYMQTCSGAKAPTGSYATEAECEAGYTALMFESTRQCRSYHVCNSASYDTANATLHCRHSFGLDQCADSGP